jgi:hypothetical protein
MSYTKEKSRDGPIFEKEVKRNDREENERKDAHGFHTGSAEKDQS